MDQTDTSSITGITNDLQNINLDVKSTTPSVTFIYENDQKTKNMSDTPNISKYFTQNNKPQATTESVSFFNEIQPSNAQDKKAAKTEPVVCRIFAEAPPQQKTDPATSFFDFIGNKNPLNTTGITTDIGLGNKESPDVSKHYIKIILRINRFCFIGWI